MDLTLSAYVAGFGGNSITSHKLDHVRVRLQEDEVHVLRIALLQLLLQKAASMLVFAET